MGIGIGRLFEKNQMTKKSILITGGAGFIGSHLVRLMVKKYPDTQIVNLDALTYAGDSGKLKDIENMTNYSFFKGNIYNAKYLKKLFTDFKFDGVIHLAAESHVDQSIKIPFNFAQTNVMGTLTLLETARREWEGSYENKLFYHVSTDEVYGSLGEKGKFLETTPYDPRSPYSASKAGVIALTKSAGKETAKFDISINCVTPAAAKTRIFDQMSQTHIDYMLSKIPRERFLQVDEAASMIAWLCSDENSFTTGAVFDLSGGRATY